MICRKSDNDSVLKTVESLKKGEISILPTDTVYGFSAITDPSFGCDKKIREIKGRAENKPFIELISSPEKIYSYTDDVIPPALLSYWPGPLTLIVKDKRLSTSENIVKTAFRCPGDSWLREILSELDYPVYSTSVNRSGFPVLDTESAILNEFEKEVSLIVLDGDKKNALPSTIVEINDGNLKVLRQGSLKIEL